MGRAFEYRKATKLKRWGHMARTFTKLGKQIAVAVKAGGPEPENNPTLRAIIATCKRENMPKDNIERAINMDDDNLEDEVSKFLSGFKMIYCNILSVLESYGVKAIDGRGFKTIEECVEACKAKCKELGVDYYDDEVKLFLTNADGKLEVTEEGELAG